MRNNARAGSPVLFLSSSSSSFLLFLFPVPARLPISYVSSRKANTRERTAPRVREVSPPCYVTPHKDVEVKIVPAVGGAFQLRAIRARKDL